MKRPKQTQGDKPQSNFLRESAIKGFLLSFGKSHRVGLENYKYKVALLLMRKRNTFLPAQADSQFGQKKMFDLQFFENA